MSNLEQLTRAQLEAMLRERGLPITGFRADLINRLQMSGPLPQMPIGEINMDPSEFSITLHRELPIAGNFAVSSANLSLNGNFLNLTLIPVNPTARQLFRFIETEINLLNHTINYITGEDAEGYTYDELKISPTDTQYILSAIPENLRGGG